MTKFDETTVQGYADWALRRLGVDNAAAGIRAHVDRNDPSRVLLCVRRVPPRCSPFALMHEMNRSFAAYTAKYSASLDGACEHLVVVVTR